MCFPTSPVVHSYAWLLKQINAGICRVGRLGMDMLVCVPVRPVGILIITRTLATIPRSFMVIVTALAAIIRPFMVVVTALATIISPFAVIIQVRPPAVHPVAVAMRALVPVIKSSTVICVSMPSVI